LPLYQPTESGTSLREKRFSKSGTLPSRPPGITQGPVERPRGFVPGRFRRWKGKEFSPSRGQRRGFVAVRFVGNATPGRGSRLPRCFSRLPHGEPLDPQASGNECLLDRGSKQRRFGRTLLPNATDHPPNSDFSKTGGPSKLGGPGFGGPTFDWFWRSSLLRKPANGSAQGVEGHVRRM